MNRNISFIVFFVIGFLINSCTEKEKVYVVCDLNNIAIHHAGTDLTKYLAEIYPGKKFEISGEKVERTRNIVLKISGEAGLLNDEAFQISGTDNQLSILGNTPRALFNGVYGLLEEMGYGFYLSFETKPSVKGGFDFTRYNFSNAPLIEERIVFNWHNFLSGCSAWDFSEWRTWIDQSSKMKFNTIMVHAYGNNPMFTYSFNGKQKKTSRLPSTRGGRDYGTQQVNDVRRLHGGDLFDHAVFGAEVSMIETEYHVKAVQEMMGRVFDHAKKQGMKISFAFDIDTNPANPQELITTLPYSARFGIPLKRNDYSGRFFDTTFWLANPDTPEGYSFYRTQLVSLLELYPQIGQVALWMRHKGSFEWLSIEEDQLPPDWQVEYREILKLHPESAEWEYAPGRFALGKVIAAYQRVLKDIGREDIGLKVGSWTFDWMNACDVLFPEEIGFIGLDYNILHGTSDIDLPDQQNRMTEISQNRPVTPVFWAHHDDGAYIGRPYTPVSDLQKKLELVGAAGFGIIHWTTWPLDSYFKNMAMQVWENSLNHDYKITVTRMAVDLFGKKQQEKTASYLYDWATSAPMMGRETREWMVDQAFTDEQLQDVSEGCLRRLALLDDLNGKSLTETGKKYIDHFRGMEKFYREFYRIENAYQNSLRYLSEGLTNKALEAIRSCNPEQITDHYSKVSAEKGITKGEKGIVISLNLCWLPYIENQRQSLGESPVRYNFAPAEHPGFGQGILRTTFFMDTDKNLWRNFGQEETGADAYDLCPDQPLNEDITIVETFQEICCSGIQSDTVIRFNIQPFMAGIQPTGPTRDLVSGEIQPGNYRLQLMFAPLFAEGIRESIQKLMIYNDPDQPAIIAEQIKIVQQTGRENNRLLKTYNVDIPAQGRLIVELIPVKGKANICGSVLGRL